MNDALMLPGLSDYLPDPPRGGSRLGALSGSASSLLWVGSRLVLWPGCTIDATPILRQFERRYLIVDLSTREPVRMVAPKPPAKPDDAYCWHWTFAALTGCTVDEALKWWTCTGIDGEDVYERLASFGLPASYYTVERPRKYICARARDLQWPLFGAAVVKLPDGDLHWVACLNGDVFDSLIGRVVSVEEWHLDNEPYQLREIIAIAPRAWGRRHSWQNERGLATAPEDSAPN